MADDDGAWAIPAAEGRMWAVPSADRVWVIPAEDDPWVIP